MAINVIDDDEPSPEPVLRLERRKVAPPPPEKDDLDDIVVETEATEEGTPPSKVTAVEVIHPTSEAQARKLAERAMREVTHHTSDPLGLDGDDEKIDKGVPLPDRVPFGKQGRPSRWPRVFAKMEVNDSVFIPNATTKRLGYLRKSAARMGYKITQRAVKERGVRGVRIWMLAKEQLDELGL